ncbi:MAG: glycosyltransferase family 2 protein [Candidatus Aceula meridiana]|nr:glycosyltransferase family 2 protein [Candidatus Aceula meridiana]
MKICIIIPVYNEAAAIGELVRQLKAKGKDILVIDDGSTDGSAGLAKAQGAEVIVHVERSGKGTSLRDGFDYAVAKGFDGVIAMDGDGQHAVSDVDKFFDKAEEFPDGIINGSRMNNARTMPFVRYWTNKLMSGIISLACRQSIPDSQCGFRFIPTRILKSVHLSSLDFEIETEVLTKASRKGFRIHSIGVETIYQDELSKINPFVDTFRFIAFMIKDLFQPKS